MSDCKFKAITLVEWQGRRVKLTLSMMAGSLSIYGVGEGGADNTQHNSTGYTHYT